MSNRLAETERHAGDLVRYAEITAVDLDAGRCVATIGEIETPPLPWITPRAGEDLAWDPPSVGEQVVVVTPAGDLAGGFILCGVFSDAVLDQLGDARGRAVFFRKFRDGSTLLFDPEASALEVVLAEQGTAKIIAKGGLTIEGPVTITGEVDITGATSIKGKTDIDGQVGVTGKVEAKGDVVGQGISLARHVHIGVQSGPSRTGAPQ